MNFSRYACSHCSDFLSDDQVRKQSAKSKRGQKTTSNESYPTAKAMPCLVLRDREQKSEEIFSQSLGSRVNLVYADERKQVVRATKQLVLLDSNSEIGHPQASRQENSPPASKQASNWCWRIKTKQKVMTKKIFWLQELKETCTFITRMEKHGTHEPWLHEQDTSVFAEEIGNVFNQRNILNGRIRAKCIDMENVYHFVDESRHSSWAEFQVQIGHPIEHKIRRARSVLANDQANKWVKAKVCVYAEMRHTPEAIKNGKIKWKESSYIRLTKMQWVSMEKQLNSSGKCSQDFHHGLLLEKSKKIWRRGESSQKSSQTGSYSWECSMTLYGMQMMRVVFQMPEKPIIMQMLGWALDTLGSKLRRKLIWKY